MMHPPELLEFSDTSALFEALRAHVDRTPPGSLVCMPTGSTPLALYRAVKDDPESRERWRSFRYLQLDEYVNPPPGTELFRDYLERRLFQPLAIDPKQQHTIPPLDTLEEEALAQVSRQLDATLSQQGPLALAVLGLGHNGHVAFNEPAQSFVRGYHLVELAASTVEHNFDPAPSQPVRALTLSIPQLLEAEPIVLVVPQADKQAILERAFSEAVNPQLPASALRQHERVTVYRIPG